MHDCLEDREVALMKYVRQASVYTQTDAQMRMQAAVNWLLTLQHAGAPGAILADEMGLGKLTMPQCLSYC